MKSSIRKSVLLPAAIAAMAFGLTSCAPRGERHEGGTYATGAAGETARHPPGDETGEPTAGTGNGGANAGGNGGWASTPPSRP